MKLRSRGACKNSLSTDPGLPEKKSRQEDARVVTPGNQDFFYSTCSLDSRIERISTGSRNLDQLLGGGVETEAITELYGESGSGKTQSCLTLCVMVAQEPALGGLNGSTLVIDTENSFKVERINSIACARGFNLQTISNKIMIARAADSVSQEHLLEKGSSIIEKKKQVKLVVVDSVISNYRAEFIGRAKLPERQQRLNRFMHNLAKLAQSYGIAVVITNQISTSPDGIFSEKYISAGGNIIAHSSNYRLLFMCSSRNRIARMIKSSYHPEMKAIFTINERGVTDPQYSFSRPE